VKSSVLMYSFEVSDQKALPWALGRYKLVHEWDFSQSPQAHSIVSAVGSVNQVQSPLILAATSDK